MVNKLRAGAPRTKTDRLELEYPMNRLLPVAFAAALLFALPAGAQDLSALTQAEAQVTAAWDAMPLTFRKALFASRIDAFGVYEEKQGSVFSADEPLVVYAEPVGYGYTANADGTYDFGFNFDLVVKNDAGEIMSGKDGFASTVLTSKVQNREFLVTLTLTLSGASPGNYVVEYLAHDVASDETATISLPFTIAD
jgi:hypothetical protein